MQNPWVEEPVESNLENLALQGHTLRMTAIFFFSPPPPLLMHMKSFLLDTMT